MQPKGSQELKWMGKQKGASRQEGWKHRRTYHRKPGKRNSQEVGNSSDITYCKVFTLSKLTLSNKAIKACDLQETLVLVEQQVRSGVMPNYTISESWPVLDQN